MSYENKSDKAPLYIIVFGVLLVFYCFVWISAERKKASPHTCSCMYCQPK